MNWLIDKLAPFFFERLPVFKWANGNKRSIGNAILVIAGTLELLKLYFPSLEILGRVDSFLVALIGLYTRIFGDIHADSKTRRGIR